MEVSSFLEKECIFEIAWFFNMWTIDTSREVLKTLGCSFEVIWPNLEIILIEEEPYIFSSWVLKKPDNLLKKNEKRFYKQNNKEYRLIDPYDNDQKHWRELSESNEYFNQLKYSHLYRFTKDSISPEGVSFDNVLNENGKPITETKYKNITEWFLVLWPKGEAYYRTMRVYEDKLAAWDIVLLEGGTHEKDLDKARQQYDSVYDTMIPEQLKQLNDMKSHLSEPLYIANVSKGRRKVELQEPVALWAPWWSMQVAQPWSYIIESPSTNLPERYVIGYQEFLTSHVPAVAA